MKARLPRAPKVDVVVTKELFEESKARDSAHCMFAEAIKAAFPTAKGVSVDIQTMRFTDPAKRLRFTYLTPRVAQIAILRFDQGEKFEAFSFRLRQGQVTASGSRSSDLLRSKRVLSEAEKEQRREAGEEGRKSMAKGLGHTTLTDRGEKGLVAERVGGKVPPITPIGRRRAFGLRAIER